MIRSSSNRSGLFLLGAALVALSTPALAQPKEPEPPPTGEDAKKLEAQRHYVAALEKHEKGDYDNAALGYLKANELYPRPLFLYNAAVAYRLGGKKDESLVHYKRYLELEPEGKGSAGARKFIPILEKEIAERDAAAAIKEKPDAGKTIETPIKTPTDLEKKDLDSSKELEESQPLPVVTRQGIDGRGSSKRIAGLITTGVGVALIGAGVGFGLHARSLSKEASEYEGPAGPALDDLYDRGDAADLNMVVLVSAGALTAAAGGVIYYLGVRDRSRAERELEIFVAPTGAGVSGRF